MWRSACVAAIACLAFAPAQAEPASDASPLLAKNLVAIGNGRHLNMVCIGEGSPTVVFEYGLGSHLLHWQKVAAPVAAITRACFYDRAGYGYSDPLPSPMTVETVTADLHALLAASHIDRPVVLVGHSLGGLYAAAHAARFPHDVVGLVLIDPSFPGQDAGASEAQQKRDTAQFESFQKEMGRCADLARTSQLTEADPHDCFALAPGRARHEIDWLMDQFLKPFRYEAVKSEGQTQRTIANVRERADVPSFGAKPVIVLTAGVPDPNPDAPEEERKAAAARWKAGHDALAARSTRGESIVVPGSGHFIQIEQPQAVIDAVRKVVIAVRASETAH
jgi:pimeloyl-ACP methyl ester carboxylesterase